MRDEEDFNKIIDQFKTNLRLGLKISRPIRFLLIGRSGVGKSSTINSLLGAEVAPVGRYRPKTKEVKEYPHTHGGYQYTVIDTPGLCDALPEDGNDAKYLADIKRVASSNLDCIWFVTGLDEERVRSDELQGIKSFTESLGKNIWDRAVIVFTGADKVNEADFDECLKERTEVIHEALERYIGKKAKLIPTAAVTNTSDTLPNGNKWLGELFTLSFERFSEEASIPFLKSMEEDLAGSAGDTESKNTAENKEKTESAADEKPRIELNKEQKERIKESLWEKAIKGAKDGAALGSTLGGAFGPKGRAIGAAVGAALGGIFGALFG